MFSNTQAEETIKGSKNGIIGKKKRQLHKVEIATMIHMLSEFAECQERITKLLRPSSDREMSDEDVEEMLDVIALTFSSISIYSRRGFDIHKLMKEWQQKNGHRMHIDEMEQFVSVLHQKIGQSIFFDNDELYPRRKK